ncbi:hypothetical protein HF086_007446 [Spodoptera exigua]|uniref:Major facilitator superfamily (MFS) profile domain-containing protein n=1 Tax=Spodoptera exigua TaxID=7107 RepID=A0A922SLR0_SPOEX|nr:hypothetical protein HF086_007446 [Spodoptera exigua]
MISPGMVTGSLVASGVSDKFGRRVTLLASALPFIIGTVTSVYLSEIADKEIRGTLTAGTRFMFSFGALLMLAIGSFVSYQVLSYFLIALPICYFLACWRIPETPYYLLKEGKVYDLLNSLLAVYPYSSIWAVSFNKVTVACEFQLPSLFLELLDL